MNAYHSGSLYQGYAAGQTFCDLQILLHTFYQFPGEYYKETIKIYCIEALHFCRIKRTYNWKFIINIKYRRYSSTFA